MAVAAGPGLWDTIMNFLSGASQNVPNVAAQASQQAAATGGQMALTPGFTDAIQNANTAAIAAGANAPAKAPQQAANVLGLSLEAQNPLAAAATAAPQSAPSAMNTPVVAAPTMPTAQMGGMHPMTQGVGNWSGEPYQPNPERGWWDTVMQNITGRDAQGNPLTDADLSEFQRNHALGATLAQIGAAISPEGSWQQRLGQAAYNIGAGGNAAMNAERQQMNQNDYMTAAARAMMGGQQGQQPKTPSGPEGPIKQPTGVYTPQTSGGGTGEPAEGANRTNASTYSLDETLNRLRRLNSGMF